MRVVATGGEPVRGGDHGAVVGDGQREAPEHAAAVHEHGAGTALTVVTALLGAGDPHPLPQRVEQGRAGVDRDVVGGTVDLQGHFGVHWRVVPRPRRSNPPT
jgi:hypothetical protein